MESGIQSRIKRKLESLGVYVINIRAPSTAGTPDLICCVEGRFIALEIKSPRSRTDTGRAKLQARQAEKIRKSGGEAYKVYSVEEAVEACGVEPL